MINVINEPTRITSSSSSLIDLIITSNLSKINVSGCYDTGISDHKLVYAIVKLYRKRSRPTIIQVKDYKSVDEAALEKDLSSVPWDICGVFDDPDDTA